jgi:hypothetical protein
MDTLAAGVAAEAVPTSEFDGGVRRWPRVRLLQRVGALAKGKKWRWGAPRPCGHRFETSGCAEDHAGVGVRRRSAAAAAVAPAPANFRPGHDSKRLEGLQGVRVEVPGQSVGLEHTRKIELAGGGNGGHDGTALREEE